VNKVGGTSAGLALKLISSGFTEVYALKGGWKEWYKSGYPVEAK
jgi:rhodanese-related sulfurtransferase